MSDQATLFLLKDKLERVRKAKRNSIIALWVMVIMAGLLWNGYFGFDFWTGFILVVVGATVFSWLIDWYYRKQEIAILWQIENMSRGNL